MLLFSNMKYNGVSKINKQEYILRLLLQQKVFKEMEFMSIHLLEQGLVLINCIVASHSFDVSLESR